MRVRTGLADGRAGRRAGFTLVEIMVVIGIIAVLASLLLGAVQRARVFGQRTTAGAEISQMDAAIAKFKQDFGFNPPQQIKFPVPGSPRDALQERTAQQLSKMFRAYNPDTTSILARDTTAAEPGNTVVLDGQTRTGIQSLVFFLGGPHIAGQAPTGFTPNLPQAPLSSSNSRKGPYYTFEAGRFIDPDTKTGTYDFRDPWRTPYAYFSSGGGSTYDASYTWQIPDRPAGTVLGAFRLGGSATGAWANPSGVQIVSAGPDGVFGQAYVAPTMAAPTSGGNIWVPKQGEYSDAAVIAGLKGNGADDISNFNGGAPLGVAGN